jgi:ABC-type sugar transport system ATPase subunit
LKESILRTTHLSKSYGSVKAVSNVDFSIEKGEIRAIVGSNGAGKSTFVKILYGEITPDEGAIYLDGKVVRFSSPKDALSSGISLVPQDFGLIEAMTVAENISLMDDTNNSIIYRESISNQRARHIFQNLAIDIDPGKIVGDLGVSEKQLVAIAKSLSVNSDIIIFDEPTSVLDANSFALIKNLLKELKSDGKAIIYVTHKLNEVFEIADSVSVFLEGEIVFTSQVDNIFEKDLLEYFSVNTFDPDSAVINNRSTPLLVVEDLTTQNLDNISFAVNTGESVGVVSNNHIESVELVKAIFGAVKKQNGEIRVRGELLTSPASCISNKVGFIPEDRRNDGIFYLFNVFENISILNFKKESRMGVVRRESLVRRTKDKIKTLRIKCESIYQPTAKLSGGNQQKVLLARWMANNFDLLLMLEPTAGIDLGGKADIHSIILGLKKNGKSFLVTSSDSRELEILCDKILYIVDGRIRKFITTAAYFSQN